MFENIMSLLFDRYMYTYNNQIFDNETSLAFNVI